jgi:hypothetical protein
LLKSKQFLIIWPIFTILDILNYYTMDHCIEAIKIKFSMVYFFFFMFIVKKLTIYFMRVHYSYSSYIRMMRIYWGMKGQISIFYSGDNERPKL